ncbi:MAG: hypothetical protein J6A58_04940 [Oscillospiraceae bacterium]|nr:hypothetical protein [Oscillospiraceae bacterium]
MRIRLELLEDTVFGSGQSVPGAEDSTILYDDGGYPYLRGTTFKGLLREAAENYICWTGSDFGLDELFGKGGVDIETERKVYVSDFVIPQEVKKSFDGFSKTEIHEATTYIRNFTRINDGVAEDGSLRSVRCIKKGLVFYGNVTCSENDKELLKEIIPMIKWLGCMRNRGMGKVNITVSEV